MEEILQELIKTTLESGPQNKQFYSNLSITKPIHDHVEIQSRLREAITFLQSSFTPEGGGYQSGFYTSRNCAIESGRVSSALSLPKNTVEILTSVLTLYLLFNSLENSETTCFQQIVTLPFEIQDALQDFIVPNLGLRTFNLFKNLELPSAPSSPLVPSQLQELQLHDDGDNIDANEYREDIDSGNDSPISMQPLPDLNDSSAPLTSFPVEDFPDDINTTALTLSVLLHQGILQPKPAESLVRWLISNIWDENAPVGEAEVASTSPSSLSESSALIKLRSFISKGQGWESDPVALANLLDLTYSLEISHEAFLIAIEEFLILTLKNAIIAETSIQTAAENSPSRTLINALGNPRVNVTSDNVSNEQDNECEEKHDDEPIMHAEIEQVEFLLNHHSPDSLLYFLSRCLAKASTTTYNHHHNGDSRPNINQMKGLLLELLDARLGTTMDTCDLAMRILAGVYLDVVGMLPRKMISSKNSLANFNGKHISNKNNTSISTTKYLTMNNLLQKEFELLVSMQNEMDGSWPADSIVQVGFGVSSISSDKHNFGSKSDEIIGEGDDDNDNNYNETEVKTVAGGSEMVVGYLGGTEIATIFAIKAISTFLNARKQEYCEDGGSGNEDDEFEGDVGHLELHHLY